MRFNVFSQGGKLYFNNSKFYVANLDKSLPPMDMGGSGDPHMMLRISGGSVLARWDDNAPGSQNKEFLFFHLETDNDTISVFYTNANFGGPKVVTSARYIHNGTSYNLTSEVTVGPITMSCGVHEISLSFEKINNVRKFGGGFALALAASKAAGGYINGGWGPYVDGYGVFIDILKTKNSNINLTRDSFVVGEGVTITNGSVSAPSDVILDTSNDDPQLILGFANANAIGARAQLINFPVDPVALQQADMAAPGGDFDGLVNPPGNSNGIIDAQGNTGPGLYIYGAAGMPAVFSDMGTHNAGAYSYSEPASIPDAGSLISWE